MYLIYTRTKIPIKVNERIQKGKVLVQTCQVHLLNTEVKKKKKIFICTLLNLFCPLSYLSDPHPPVLSTCLPRPTPRPLSPSPYVLFHNDCGN